MVGYIAEFHHNISVSWSCQAPMIVAHMALEELRLQKVVPMLDDRCSHDDLLI